MAVLGEPVLAVAVAVAAAAAAVGGQAAWAWRAVPWEDGAGGGPDG